MALSYIHCQGNPNFFWTIRHWFQSHGSKMASFYFFDMLNTFSVQLIYDKNRRSFSLPKFRSPYFSASKPNPFQGFGHEPDPKKLGLSGTSSMSLLNGHVQTFSFLCLTVWFRFVAGPFFDFKILMACSFEKFCSSISISSKLDIDQGTLDYILDMKEPRYSICNRWGLNQWARVSRPSIKTQDNMKIFCA